MYVANGSYVQLKDIGAAYKTVEQITSDPPEQTNPDKGETQQEKEPEKEEEQHENKRHTERHEERRKSRR